MSSAHRYLPHYTVDDYQQWEGDWELWQGIPVSMSPSPFGRHQQTAIALATAVKNSIDSQTFRAVVLAEIDWIISDDTVVRPDVVILCGDAPERHVENPPAAAAEIVSDSSRSRDREAKFELYQEQGVNYYLILDPAQNSIHSYHLNTAGKFELEPPVDELELNICQDCRIAIPTQKLFS